MRSAPKKEGNDWIYRKGRAMAVPLKRSTHPLAGVIEDRNWIDVARCHTRGELFFEAFRERPDARERRVAAAKCLCAEGPVSLECRDAGRRNHELGIWGGETEEERARAGFPMRTLVRHSVIDARRDAQANAAEVGSITPRAIEAGTGGEAA